MREQRFVDASEIFHLDDYPEYEVHGGVTLQPKIYSLHRNQYLKSFVNGKRVVVVISRKGHAEQIGLGRLVMMAHGKIVKRQRVLHRDEDKDNNIISNLYTANIVPVVDENVASKIIDDLDYMVKRYKMPVYKIVNVYRGHGGIH